MQRRAGQGLRSNRRSRRMGEPIFCVSQKLGAPCVLGLTDGAWYAWKSEESPFVRRPVRLAPDSV